MGLVFRVAGKLVAADTMAVVVVVLVTVGGYGDH